MIVSPEAYMKIYHSNAGLIKQAIVLPPALGGNGFGRIAVEFHVPVAEVLLTNSEAHEHTERRGFR